LNGVPAEHTAAAGPRCFSTLTLSKAIGGHGGLIAGSRAFVARLKQTGGIFAGGTAPAAPVAAASAAGLRLALADGQLRKQLQRNVGLLGAGLARLGLPAGNGLTPIVSLVPADARRLGELQAELLRRDIAVGYLRSYTNLGPHGALRIAVFADHEPWMIERLLTALADLPC
jgi:7-keto-8-aminopelargonate synthetase-like enzyme